MEFNDSIFNKFNIMITVTKTNKIRTGKILEVLNKCVRNQLNNITSKLMYVQKSQHWVC